MERNKVEIVHIEKEEYTEPFGGFDFSEEKQEIHDIFIKHSETGNVYDDDTNGRMGFSYNIFNPLASSLFHEFCSKYHYSFIEDVANNIGIIYSKTGSRMININATNNLRSFLKNNFPIGTFECIRDLFAYGWCGFLNISKEDKNSITRIPVRECELYFPNTSDEFIRFFSRSGFKDRKVIEYHSRNTIELVEYDRFSKYNWFKVVDGVIEQGYKEKPYMIYIGEFDDNSEKPNSICMKLKKFAIASSELHGLMLHMTHKAVNPAIVVDMDSNPRSEDSLDAMNPQIDLRPNGVNHVNGMRNGLPIQPISDKTSGGTHAEIMSYLNNLDGYIASSFHVSAMMGATKSNVTQGAISSVNEIQEIMMEEERRKFLREFFKIFLFKYCNKLGFKIDSMEDLYFGFVDGNFNIADTQKQLIMQDIASLMQVGLGNLIDPKKVVAILKDSSYLDIYNEDVSLQAPEPVAA